MHKKLCAITLCGLFSFVALGDTSKTESLSFLEQVQADFLASYGPAEARPDLEKEVRPTTGQLLKEAYFGKAFTPPSIKMSKRTWYELLLEVAPPQESSFKPCTDTTSLRKLEFFCGGEKRGETLLSRIGKHLQTCCSTSQAVALLAQPTADLAILSQRREAIRAIAADEELLSRCVKTCKQMARGEECFLQLCLTELPVTQGPYKELYFSSFFDKLLASGNKRTVPLEIGTQTQNLAALSMGNPFSRMCSLVIWYLICTGQADGFATILRAGALTKQLLNPTTTFNRTAHPALRALSIPAMAFASLFTYQSYRLFKFQYDAARYLQDCMGKVASYIRGMKQFYALAESEPALHELPLFKHLKELVAPTGKHSAHFNKLVSLLDANTFSGEPSVFSIFGRVLAARELMKEVKGEFADALRAAGEFETYVAVAQLVNEHAEQNARYCFVDFVEGTQEPTIEARGLWNPFVDPKQAVTNDITFGSNGLRGMILTGPNTGGKSTIIKGLMTNIIMAQTFGIAAADLMTFTPFDKLCCHLNIADDTAGGVSLFKAEVLRAQELIKTLKELPQDQRAFLIIDEIFTATSPDQAAKLSYDFIKQVAKFQNCAFVDATHFKNVTRLTDENKACQNYHMEAITDANGRVERYTYKLKPGISQVQNAAQVAQEGSAFDTVFG